MFALFFFFFFFQAEDGIRDGRVTGVQTCALPILKPMLAVSNIFLTSPALRCVPAIILNSIVGRSFMARFVSIASAFTLALLVGSQAIAQQPPANPPSGGTPDAMPFDI